MVAPASPLPRPVHNAPTSPRYGVEVLGRLYPRRLRPQSDQPLLDVERERNARIAGRLHDELPWFGRSPSDYARVEDMVRSYEDGVRLLSFRHQEVADLLWEVAASGLQVNVTETGGAQVDRESLLKRLHHERFQQAAFPPFKPDQVLSASLLTRPIDEVHERLSRSLDALCHRVVQAAFEALDRLVDRSVVGLIEWTSPSLCMFHYFRESSDYRASIGQEVENETWDDGWNTQSVTTTTTSRDEVESRVRQRHEHHLMEAEAVELPAEKVVVPTDVQPVIDKVPGWLRPETRVVVGTQFRGDIVEQQLKERVWLKERVVHRTIETQYDPAVTVDRFVLSGWGEPEIEAEQLRRQAAVEGEERTIFVREHGWTERFVRWSAGLGVFAYLLSQLGSVAFLLLSLFLIGVATWQTGRGLQNAVHYYKPASPWQVYAFGIGGRLMRWLAALLLVSAVASLSAPLGALAVLLGGIGTGLVYRVDKVLGVPLFLASE